MRVLLTSAGLETDEIKEYFMDMLGKDMSLVKALFIPTAAIGNTAYLLERINVTGFHATLMDYIRAGGIVIGVSAGSLIFSNNLPDNLGLIDTKLDVHCAKGEKRGKVAYPLKEHMRLTNTCALAIWGFPDDLEIIGE